MIIRIKKDDLNKHCSYGGKCINIYHTQKKYSIGKYQPHHAGYLYSQYEFSYNGFGKYINNKKIIYYDYFC